MRAWLAAGMLLVAGTAQAQQKWSAVPLPFTAFDEDAASPPTDARDVAVLKDGSVAVLDFGRQEVRVFTADGKPVRTLGRKGKGPGEFDLANGIVATADGGLVVYDPTNARLSVFDAAGAFVRVVPVRFYSYGYRWGGIVMADGRTAEVGYQPPKQPDGTEMAIVRRSVVAERADTIPLPACPVAPKYPPYLFKNGNAGVPFSPSVRYAIDPKGALWCGATNAYEVWRIPLGATKPGQIVRGSVKAEPVTDAEAKEALAGLREFAKKVGGGDVDPSRFPKTKPVFKSLTVDDRGRLWVLRLVGDKSVFDVFGGGAAPVASVTMPVKIADYDRIIVQGGVMTAVMWDEDEVQRVVRFRIRE